MFLGRELIIASPKSFAVCFLCKFCISHQKESPAISCPCLVSATGNGDAGQTRGRSPWGDRKRRLEADQGTPSVSCPHPPWTATLRPGVCSASGDTEAAGTHPFSRIFLSLLDDLFASSPRISSPAIYGDFTAAHTEAASCSHAQGSSPHDSILVFTLVCAKTPFILSPSRAWLVPGTKQLAPDGNSLRS